MLLSQQTLLAAPDFLSESAENNTAALVVHWKVFSPEINRQLTEYTLRCLVLWGCWLRKPDQWITRIELPCANNSDHDTSAYRFFRYAIGESGQLLFGNKRCALVLNKATFERRLRIAARTQTLTGQQRSDIVNKAREVIEAGLRDGHLTRRVVAARLCVSERTLQRQLTVYGTSYGELLRQARLHYACYLLRETDRQVLDIALEVGFRDAANLCRLFRSQLHTTPSHYREYTRHQNPLYAPTFTVG